MKSVTKKPESVIKTQLGGRPKREMLKQLPVLESEGAGKIKRKKPVKALANVNKRRKAREIPKEITRRKKFLLRQRLVTGWDLNLIPV